MQYYAPFGSLDPTASWVNANPAAGIAGSIPDCGAIEGSMREIVNTIAAAGLTPSGTDLTQLMQAVRGGALSYFADTGTANSLIVQPNPAYLNYFTGMTLTVKPAFAPTGPATINVNGLTAKPITKKGGTALAGGEWSNGDVIELKYNGSSFQLVGGGAMSGGGNLQFWSRLVAGTYSYIVPAGVSAILAQVWGGGGAGSSVPNPTTGSAGGGGGGFTEDILNVVPGQVFAVIVGIGAPRPTAGAYAGTNGGTSSFGSAMSATGGSGSAYPGPGRAPGGIGIGGSINIAGGVGRTVLVGGDNVFHGGDGGQSWCSGDTSFSNGGQHDGQAPGQGGSGASSLSGASSGGAGAPGAVIVQSVG